MALVEWAALLVAVAVAATEHRVGVARVPVGVPRDEVEGEETGKQSRGLPMTLGLYWPPSAAGAGGTGVGRACAADGRSW